MEPLKRAAKWSRNNGVAEATSRINGCGAIEGRGKLTSVWRVRSRICSLSEPKGRPRHNGLDHKGMKESSTVSKVICNRPLSWIIPQIRVDQNFPPMSISSMAVWVIGIASPKVWLAATNCCRRWSVRHGMSTNAWLELSHCSRDSGPSTNTWPLHLCAWMSWRSTPFHKFAPVERPFAAACRTKCVASDASWDVTFRADTATSEVRSDRSAAAPIIRAICITGPLWPERHTTKQNVRKVVPRKSHPKPKHFLSLVKNWPFGRFGQ